jgi:hypothetical protein
MSRPRFDPFCSRGAVIEQGRYIRDWSLTTVRTYQQKIATLLKAVSDGPVDQRITKASLQTFVLGCEQKDSVGISDLGAGA